MRILHHHHRHYHHHIRLHQTELYLSKHELQHGKGQLKNCSAKCHGGECQAHMHLLHPGEYRQQSPI